MKESEQNTKEIDMLGMWMAEDMMRALDMDINKVEQFIILPSRPSAGEETAQRQWYEQLITMMKAEGIEQSGHLKMCHDAVQRLTTRHKALLKDPKNQAYRDLYYDALPAIVDFRSRQQMPEAQKESHHPEIESWLEMLYGVRLLQLQGKPVSEPTLQAARKVQTLLDTLTGKSDNSSDNSNNPDSSNN